MKTIKKRVEEMNMHITRKEYYAILTAALAVMIAIAWVGFGSAAKQTYTYWAMCQPGDRVNLRMEPDKRSTAVGWLECGDSFETDGTIRNGWLRAQGVGECECWIYCGYVVTEKPVPVYENYVCVAKKQVACRRWVDGPQIVDKGRKRWLQNGSSVSVFYIAGEWAVTNRGYIKSQWLEVDAE